MWLWSCGVFTLCLSGSHVTAVVSYTGPRCTRQRLSPPTQDDAAGPGIRCHTSPVSYCLLLSLTAKPKWEKYLVNIARLLMINTAKFSGRACVSWRLFLSCHLVMNRIATMIMRQSHCTDGKVLCFKWTPSTNATTSSSYNAYFWQTLNTFPSNISTFAACVPLCTVEWVGIVDVINRMTRCCSCLFLLTGVFCPFLPHHLLD